MADERVDYDQGKDQRWNIWRVTSDGVCLGLAILWVRESRDGVPLLQWLGPPPQASKQGSNPPSFGGNVDRIKRIMDQQQKLIKVAETGGSYANVHGFFSTIMLWAYQRCTDRTDKIVPDIKLGASVGAFAAVMAEHDGYSLFIFDRSGWGRHACACYCSRAGDSLIYFDPNWGEYAMKPSEFRSWLVNNFMRRYGFIMVTGAVLPV